MLQMNYFHDFWSGSFFPDIFFLLLSNKHTLQTHTHTQTQTQTHVHTHTHKHTHVHLLQPLFSFSPNDQTPKTR